MTYRAPGRARWAGDLPSGTAGRRGRRRSKGRGRRRSKGRPRRRPAGGADQAAGRRPLRCPASRGSACSPQSVETGCPPFLDQSTLVVSVAGARPPDARPPAPGGCPAGAVARAEVSGQPQRDPTSVESDRRTGPQPPAAPRRRARRASEDPAPRPDPELSWAHVPWADVQKRLVASGKRFYCDLFFGAVRELAPL